MKEVYPVPAEFEKTASQKMTATRQKLQLLNKRPKT
jgi:hypothetical protein